MNTRKDNNGKALAAWKRLGPGMIEKPLRFIGERTNGRDEHGRVVLSANYLKAAAHASRGDGLTVQRMALALA